jgi:signal transduction histidine kinase
VKVMLNAIANFWQRFNLQDSSLRIHQKIGYGYFLAIGIGFFGSLMGLIIADSYQRQGIKQEYDAHIQAQLLGNFQDAALQAQLQGGRLGGFLNDSDTLFIRKTEFIKAIKYVTIAQAKIEDYLNNKPSWLGRDPMILRKALQSYVTSLTNYQQAIELQLKNIDNTAAASQKIDHIYLIENGKNALILDRHLGEINQILDIAQRQEIESSNKLREVQVLEKIIIIISMLLSVALASVIAYRTSRAIASPLITVTALAEKVAQESNFDLRAPLSSQDEIASLAISLNHLIERVSTHTKELEKAKANAESANLAKSQFLANMSHELRTPLNAILGYSEILTEESEILGLEDFLPDLEKIKTAGKNLLSLINDILDFSKIEAGKMRLYWESFHIATLIDEIVATVKPLMNKNNNVFKIDCDSNINFMHSDLTKVRQVLLNLLSNAAKFTQQGKITLKAWVIPGKEEENESRQDHFLPLALACPLPHTQEGEDWICFQVKDTGIGMSENEQHRLFEAFTQGDTSATRKYGGSGLGLTISRHFCLMMGGEILVESELEKGSTFTVRLPLQSQK